MIRRGADDYMTMPFSSGVLLPRMPAALRHAQPAPEAAVFRSGPSEVDSVARLVTVKGREVNLAATEYSLLRFFAQHAGKLLTHRRFLCEV